MIDWHSDEQIASNAVAFDKLVHVLFGIYIWELLSSLDFDLAFLTGERRFKWTLVFYFYGRYAMLGAWIGMLVVFNTRRELDCYAVYIALTFLSNSAMGVASINLSLRAIAVWSNSLYTVALIVLLVLAHTGIFIYGVSRATSHWTGSTCETKGIQTKAYAALYILTMVFDFIVMYLTAYKLWLNMALPQYQTKTLVRLILRDGLLYFLVAALVNMLSATLSILDLNPIMSVIADFPAASFATIAAGRVVRRLNIYIHDRKAEQVSAPVAPTVAGFAAVCESKDRIEMTTIATMDFSEFSRGSDYTATQGHPHDRDRECDPEAGLAPNDVYKTRPE